LPLFCGKDFLFLKMRSIKNIAIERVVVNQREKITDQLAVEEPLEIQLAYGQADKRLQKSISITMRTPGQDFDLATGFLFTEGIIQHANQIKDISHPSHWNPDSKENIVLVELTEEVEIHLKKLERHFYTTSSCGVCGKTSIEALHTNHQTDFKKNHPTFASELIYQLPQFLQKEQSIFQHTGGIHAAALFDNKGNLYLLREDIGRHNAVDKLIGAALQKGLLPLHDYLILVSGRASFELVQKSMIADIPILAAVGAPSSLAVDLANKSNMTLLGFVKKNKLNIYTHPERII